ncbi:hypothetical protein GQ43DRAFT_117623 [Delitschia confertaspora ATCC 74209]|uniref:Uncharacterized protein n=1 Tax=Delitschia confertaspora ATCC 74209 TaxID=1513339 RepID=A0A9P4JHA7_9PLEO|nr:hypothetical protein GQ43DRAFT_117623 [Delitschia confertaspora ATCC 74209]
MRSSSIVVRSWLHSRLTFRQMMRHLLFKVNWASCLCLYQQHGSPGEVCRECCPVRSACLFILTGGRSTTANNIFFLFQSNTLPLLHRLPSRCKKALWPFNDPFISSSSIRPLNPYHRIPGSIEAGEVVSFWHLLSMFISVVSNVRSIFQ